MTDVGGNRWARWQAEIARNWRELPTWQWVVSAVALVLITGGFILELTVKPHLIGSLTLLVGVVGNLVMVCWRMMHQVNSYKRPEKAG